MSNPDALVSPLTPDEAYAKAVNGDLIGPMELLSPEPYAEVPREAWKLSGLAPRTCWLRSLEIPADEEIEWFEYAGVRVDGSRLTRDGTRLVQQEDGTWLAVPVPGAYNLQLRLLAAGSLWAFQFKARPTVRDVPVQIHADALTERAARAIARQQLLAAASMAPDYRDGTPEDAAAGVGTPPTAREGAEREILDVYETARAHLSGLGVDCPEEAYAHVARAGMVEPVMIALALGSSRLAEHTQGDLLCLSGQVDRTLWLRSLEIPEGEELVEFRCADVGALGAALSRDGTRLVHNLDGTFEDVPVPGAYNLWPRFLPVGAVWEVYLRARPIARQVTIQLHADALNPFVSVVSGQVVRGGGPA